LKEGITLTANNNRRILSDIEEEESALKDTMNKAFERTARETLGDDFVDMQMELYSPEDILSASDKAEADRIKDEFAERVRKIKEIKTAAQTIPLLSSRQKTTDEVVNGIIQKKIQNEINTITEILEIKDDNPVAVGQAAMLSAQMRKYLKEESEYAIDVAKATSLLETLDKLVSDAAELMDKLDKDQERKQDAKWERFVSSIETSLKLAILILNSQLSKLYKKRWKLQRNTSLTQLQRLILYVRSLKFF
jgi:hypothetical protein